MPTHMRFRFFAVFALSFSLPFLIILPQLALSAQDSTSAGISSLDSSLATDPDNYELLLQRGHALLDAGRLNEARKQFQQLIHNSESSVRCRAYAGLGDVYLEMPKKKMQALRYHRIAESIEPDNLDIKYGLANVGLRLQWTDGHMLASRELKEIICAEPDYRDAYSIWRERILGHSFGELREMDRCLENHLRQNPDRPRFWLDIAKDQFHMLEVENCLSTLDSLIKYAPEYRQGNRNLLEARCYLDLQDTLAFEQLYFKALESAHRENDFEQIVQEAEPIFTPEETKFIEEVKEPERLYNFIRVFWKKKDPDPTDTHNERLLTHYLRLREAETYYRLRKPDSWSQTNPTYNRMFFSWFEMGVEYEPYEYKPEEISNSRTRRFQLDHRGQLLVRHGPPDEISYIEMWEPAERFMFAPSPAKTWRYGGNVFTFKEVFGVGEFIFAPTPGKYAADVMHAMATEFYKDPLKNLEQNFYGANFLTEDGNLELEVYQSLACETAETQNPPGVIVTVFDSLLNEEGRDSTIAVKIKVNNDSLWLGINRLSVEPGQKSIALKLDIPGSRCVERTNLTIEPYPEGELSISGVVLGTPAIRGKEIYSRMGVALVPRPSLRFSSNETIAVYLEVYGLSALRDEGRSYAVTVTVSRMTKDEGRLASLIKKLRLSGRLTETHRTLSFERRVLTRAGQVPEYFTLDASELVPGLYNLAISVVDDASGQRAGVVCSFMLVD